MSSATNNWDENPPLTWSQENKNRAKNVLKKIVRIFERLEKANSRTKEETH